MTKLEGFSKVAVIKWGYCTQYHFAIYDDGEWKYVSAKHFVPYDSVWRHFP